MVELDASYALHLQHSMLLERIKITSQQMNFFGGETKVQLLPTFSFHHMFIVGKSSNEYELFEWFKCYCSVNIYL